MKKSLLSLVLCFFVSTMFAAELNIYASGLKAGALSAENTLEIEYVLNAPATSLDFQVLNANGVVVKTIELTDATLLTKGAHTGVSIDLSDCPAGTYTWALKASAAAVSVMTEVTDGTDNFHRFFHSRGMGVDVNPQNDFFGRIYVGNAKAGTTGGSAQTLGVFILDPLLKDVTEQGRTGYTGGVNWAGAEYGPRRLAVSEDGYVFIADQSADNSGVWMMNPAKPSEAFKEVLASAGRGTIYKDIDAFAIVGTGTERKLYTLESIYETADGPQAKVYPIGECETPYAQAGTTPPYTMSGLYNDAATLLSDGRGGFWIAQHRSGNGDALLQHYKNGARDFKIGGSDNTDLMSTANSMNRGVIAINKDQTLLAYGKNGSVAVCDLSYDESGVPTLKKKCEMAYSTGNRTIDALAFDYANNVYAISTYNEKLKTYALPTDNVQTTPAQAKYGFEIAAKEGDVVATSISITEGTEKTLEKGETFQLTAVVTPDNHTSSVAWSSDKEAVATVVNGLITAVGPGEATITASIDAQVAEFKVTVKKPVVTITEGAAADLAQNAELQLHATLAPADDDATYTWESSNTAIATVTAEGLVKAVGTGEATITVATADSEVASIVITIAKGELAAGTYKVGGEGADYASLAAACADLNDKLILGDVTLAICADLTEPANIGLINTTEHTISIRPDGEELRTITFTQETANAGVEGSLIIGAYKPVISAYSVASKNIIIDGTAIDGTESCLKFVHQNYGGHLVVYGAATDVVINNISQSCEVTGGSTHEYRIQSDGNNAPAGIVISNNYITGKNTSRAIALYGGSDHIIEGNTFALKEMLGSTLAYGIHGSDLSGTITIRGNKFVAVESATVSGVAAINTAGNGTWVIENNYFAGMDAKLTEEVARIQYIRNANNGTIMRHNTFYVPAFTGTPSNTTSGNAIVCIELALTADVIENNIFVSEESKAVHAFVKGNLSYTKMQNCRYYHVNGDAGLINFTANTWATYSVSDNTAKWVQPKFVDAAKGNLDLAEANDQLLVGKLDDVTTDIYGTERKSNYAGAFEYVATSEGGTTDIENAEVENTNVRKVVENGQVVIIRDGVRYNVLGNVIE